MSNVDRSYFHEVEEMVIGGLFLDSSQLDKVKVIITQEDFGLKLLGRCYKQMIILKNFTVFDIVNDLKLDKDEEIYLYELCNLCPSTINIARWAKLIKKKSILRTSEKLEPPQKLTILTEKIAESLQEVVNELRYFRITKHSILSTINEISKINYALKNIAMELQNDNSNKPNDSTEYA